MAKGTVRGFVVATVCQTLDAFIERYWSRVGSNWIFVSVIDERVVGCECGFAILLADRHPILAGICEVVEVFPDANNQFRRAGMALRIRRLGLESERVFDMLVARATSGRTGARLARGSDAPMREVDARCALVDVDYDAVPVDVDDEAIPVPVDDPWSIHREH